MGSIGEMIAQWDYSPLIDQSWMIVAALLGVVVLGAWLSVWRANRGGSSTDGSSSEIAAIVLTIVLLVWLALGKRKNAVDASISPEDGRVLLVHVPEVQEFLVTQANASAINAVQIFDSDPETHTVEYGVGDYDKSKRGLTKIWHRFRVNTANRQVTVFVDGPHGTDWISVEVWRATSVGSTKE
jgi:hypothetical protein